MTSPIGLLIVEASEKAIKKIGRPHTAEADCGCRVLVSYCSPGSSNVEIHRCSEHAYQRDANGRVLN